MGRQAMMDPLTWEHLSLTQGRERVGKPQPPSALSRPKSWWPRSGRIRFECKRLGQVKSLAAVMSVQ